MMNYGYFDGENDDEAASWHTGKYG